MNRIEIKHPPPVTILPIFLCLPDFVVGIPVAFAIFLFAFVIPVALFQLNDSPSIPVLVPFFLVNFSPY
jgi:hypothetical protein